VHSWEAIGHTVVLSVQLPSGASDRLPVGNTIEICSPRRTLLRVFADAGTGGAESPPASLVGRDEQPAVAIGHAIWQAVEPAHVGAGPSNRLTQARTSSSSTGV
jgi:hypothetical protein